MAKSLTWLADVLTAAGLKVSKVPGWENRGFGDVGRIFGVICHHTATKSKENMPTLDLLVAGRSDLPGPLAQLGLGRDGTFFVVAAGRANHAGKGRFQHNGTVFKNGNSNFIGIEAENSGLPNDPWPEVQVEAYQRGVAAILQHLSQKADFCIGHKEWAPHRKPDPTLEMNDFRGVVASILAGDAPPPPLIPPAEPPVAPGGPVGRPTLRRGMSGDLTREVQRKVGVTVDGDFGPKTEAAVRAFQRNRGLVADGIVGPRTWRELDTVT